MRESTACFIINPEGEVLLGFKKSGFGAGKFAGIGGKVEPGETIEEAAIREVKEEIGVNIGEDALIFMGALTFIFPSKAEWSQKVSVFVVEKWTGEPKEGQEMKPSWYKPAEIPFGNMWSDARYWLPQIINGEKIFATFFFKKDNASVESVSYNSD